MERKTKEVSWWKLEEEKGVMTLREADPIRHGHWIRCKAVKAYECSCCDALVTPGAECVGLIELYKYCPYCGARMDR